MIFEELEDIIKQEDILFIETDSKKQPSKAMQDLDGCAIFFNDKAFATTAKKREVLYHETGHCVTGSFYNIYSPFDIRQKHENTADRWAIKELLPFDEMRGAMREGYTEVWELAEYFDVTESFVRRAYDYYINARGLDFNSPL